MNDDIDFIQNRTVSKSSSRADDKAAPIEITNTSQLNFFEPNEITRPELNIAKFASMIFTSPYGRGKYEVREYNWKSTVNEQEVDSRLVVRPGKDLKTPTTTSYQVFLALVQLWEQQGRVETGEVIFSARQLAKLMNWKWEGKAGKRIQEQIEILFSTSLNWEWSFALDKKNNRDRLVVGMHILEEGSHYVPQRTRLKGEKFDAIHKVKIGHTLIKNMNQGVVKPVNYFAFLSIKNDTAKILYTLLDVIMSGKPHQWQRRAYGLIRQDLGLHGERYEQKKHRHALLKQMVAEISGKSVGYGFLELHIEPTVDKNDYKLVVTVKRVPKARIAPPRKLANPKELVPIIRDELIEGLKRIPSPRSEAPNPDFIESLAKWYPEAMLRDVLSIVKSDYRGKIKASAVRTYIMELHIECHRRGLDWVKPCHPSKEACRYQKSEPLFEAKKIK